MNIFTKRVWYALLVAVATTFLLSSGVAAQKSNHKKYPSLFWEITGNGLKKPSYLFGTMHVSSKMVFHLSDSFYHAIRSADAVALELNPETWQDQMFRLQNAQVNLSKFSLSKMDDLINEESFRLQSYDDNLKRALSEEPTVVNSLLYRSYQPQADFEENTYLDLYIYQTGRKMGKIAAGVENYRETEKLMMEAYQDMAKEKNKKQIDTDGESMFEIQKKMQEAYRKGDLDLMDSLDKITSVSVAFNEKFLYQRNVIQANSMDTILKKRSLFVGVGAAHLPGERGVIELLRRKGYKLRPIFMQDRDAVQKEQVDKLRVTAPFKTVTSDDGFIKVQIPGQFYKRDEARRNESWQYADMNNGSYYMLTRVGNHAAMLGDTEKEVLRKVDSMLYENIPGKIVRKTLMNKNGYSGYDITNRTRRGDIQRYNILVTPFEVLVFKMSGNDDYVEGKEGDAFFSSIELKEQNNDGWVKYEPVQGGFSLNLPQAPHVSLNNRNRDRIERWEYEAIDKKTGDSYMIWKKSVHNTNFIEEDTFDLSLLEESFKKSDFIDKQLSRSFGVLNGINYLDMKFALKDGQYLNAKALIKGPHYFLLTARSKSKVADAKSFFNSFAFTPFKYNEPVSFTDTSLNFKVLTPVIPALDTALRSWLDKATSDEILNASQENFNYWPRTKSAIFKSDTTGEAILISVETFPKYYYSRDTAAFWKDKLDDVNISKDMVVAYKRFFKEADSTTGYNLTYVDTNSSRAIKTQFVLKNNRLFKFTAVTDTTSPESSFIKSFFTSFEPMQRHEPSIFENKLDLFFADYNSKDSTIKKLANSSISNIYFGKKGIDRLLTSIKKLKYNDRNYFEIKSKLITELGYINDSCCTTKIVDALKDIYQQSADTSFFQNPVLIALAQLKTRESFAALKDMLVQDPPVFDNDYENEGVFDHLSDTLSLAKEMFPDLLQLASLEDYKDKVNALLRTLVDSGYLQSKDYESYFSKIYFDAKIQLKKQQNKDEQLLERETAHQEEDDYNDKKYNDDYGQSSLLDDYTVLLIPFYDTNPTIPKFFAKLLASKDKEVQMHAAVLMIRNKKPVADSLFEALAAKDQYRSQLLARLEKIKRVDLFPAKYRNQVDIARSILMSEDNMEKFYAIELVNKKYVEVQGEKGYAYMFKYKIKKGDDWKMGISGLQPKSLKETSTRKLLVKLTDRKLRTDEPADEQFDKQLKRLVFSMRQSSREFFIDNEYGNYLSRRFQQDRDE